MDTYEKKYKEAQKWIESIYPNLSHEQQMEAETFFPELAESEDEKIRKDIIDFVRHSVNRIPAQKFNKYIVWLEKQGGEKPADEVESITQSYIIPNEKFFQWIYDRLVHVHNENPNVDYMLSLKKRIEDMQNPANDDMKEAPQTEYEKSRADAIAEIQKPAEWSEEDERMIDNIIFELEENQENISGVGYKIDWLNSLKEKIGGKL